MHGIEDVAAVLQASRNMATNNPHLCQLRLRNRVTTRLRMLCKEVRRMGSGSIKWQTNNAGVGFKAVAVVDMKPRPKCLIFVPASQIASASVVSPLKVTLHV
jgi:hypothetical protein